MNLRQVQRDPAPGRYGRLLVHTGSLAAADWIAEGGPNQGPFATVEGNTATGYPAYARILHPASLDERPVRWDAVGAAYGRAVDGTTRWHELVGVAWHQRCDQRHDEDPTAPAVWDEPPGEGPTPLDLARTLLPVLARHTRTADRVWYGLWHGYGRWGWDGIPCFPTPNREEVLLSGPLADAISPATELDEFAELPDRWWPEDRAWVLGGDVDLMSTYVAGPEPLIADLLTHPALEAHRVAPTARLD
ncbi:hypothetical protein [Streptomyces sp. NPDC097619]|uniref:hypothetical protein n=1 Tax=Streptomyces sp. NPDC097619 TaxID=3157228 RepID=UPI003330BC4F